jgi:hypothetical protein
MALFSEEGMLARRRLDINASYGCSLICRFCFHLGIAGDMKHKENEQGDNDVAFTYDRKIRYHSPRYIINLVKYARERFGVDFVGFLDENLMTMHQFSGKKWLTDIARLWIEEGLQPQCVRDGVPHESREVLGHPLGRDEPRHPVLPRGAAGDQAGRLLTPRLRLRELLCPRDEDHRQGRHPGDQRAVARGRWRRASGPFPTR